MQKNAIATLAAIVLTAACLKGASSGSDASFPTNPVSLSEGDTTLAGADGDGDGIRDDLGQYIVARYPALAQQSIFKNWARAATAELLATGRTEVYKAQVSVDQAMVCIYNNLGLRRGRQEEREMLAALLNTDLRLTTYLSNIQNLGGMVFLGDSKSTCSIDGSRYNGQH